MEGLGALSQERVEQIKIKDTNGYLADLQILIISTRITSDPDKTSGISRVDQKKKKEKENVNMVALKLVQSRLYTFYFCPVTVASTEYSNPLLTSPKVISWKRYYKG